MQETLVIPLYGRKMCLELYPNLYRDETALRLINQIDYDFSLLSQKSKSRMQQFGLLEAAMRQNDLAWEVRDYLREHRTRRSSTSAADWTTRAAAATTAPAGSITSIFPA